MGKSHEVGYVVNITRNGQLNYMSGESVKKGKRNRRKGVSHCMNNNSLLQGKVLDWLESDVISKKFS